MRGPRLVMVPESGISEAGLDALARALSQHPRMLFFAVNVSRKDIFERTDSETLRLLRGEQSSFFTCVRAHAEKPIQGMPALQTCNLCNMDLAGCPEVML